MVERLPENGTLYFVASVNEKTDIAESDEKLVAQAVAGSREAFELLVRRYMHKAVSIARHFVKNTEDAKDLSQDAFLKIYQSLDSFDPKYKFFSWFYRILVNHCINHNRRKSLVQFFSLHTSNTTDREEQTIDVVDPDGQTGNWEQLQNSLHRAIQKLPVKHRTAVILCDIEGIPQTEASEMLGVSEGTLRSRLHYGRKKLKDYLNKYTY